MVAKTPVMRLAATPMLSFRATPTALLRATPPALFRATPPALFRATPVQRFRATPVRRIFAAWYAGKHKKHRRAREKRYHPKFSIQNFGRNNNSRKLFYKTNRWNYIQAYRDMP
jgi:hypothetical protein